MQKWGRNLSGCQRWRCAYCKTSHTAARHDTRQFWRKQLFASWLTGAHTLSEIARKHKATRRTLEHWFSPFWHTLPKAEIPESFADTWLSVDATYLGGRKDCVMIGRTGNGHVVWDFAEHETLVAWSGFFNKLPKPAAIIFDGQKGLISAQKSVWPDVPAQRCLAHIQRLAIQKLTRNPRTIAGQELSRIVSALHSIKTHDDKGRWLVDFEAWKTKYVEFLKERSQGEGRGRWQYKHRRVRAMRRSLEDALPNLFVFLDYPGLPKTTNHVEGGLNSRLKELIRRHRGLDIKHKKALAAYFLASKTFLQKPTRNFT